MDLVIDGATVNAADVDVVPKWCDEVTILHTGTESGEYFGAEVRIGFIEGEDAIVGNLKENTHMNKYKSAASF